MIRPTMREMAARLERLPIVETMEVALEGAAGRLAEGVRARLSHPPGGEHEAPWQRTGRLHDSVGHSAEGLRAAVGSTEATAAFQEQGTVRIPPRPFLAPDAAERGEALAREIGRAVAAVLAGEGGAGTDISDR